LRFIQNVTGEELGVRRTEYISQTDSLLCSIPRDGYHDHSLCSS